MFHDIAAFLSPFFARESEREALLLNAFYGHEAVLNKINYTGAAGVFVPRLIHVLQSYGEIAPGTQALWQLLLTLRSQVGRDNQRRIDSFQAWANTSHTVTLEPADLAGSTTIVNNNDNRINISGNVQGGNVNIGGQQTVHGNVTITMRDLNQTIQKGATAPDDKVKLQQLVEDLKTALETVPAEHKANAEKVAKRTEELVSEVSASEIEANVVVSKANTLKTAAENIKGVLPTVFEIAGSIVAFALRVVGMPG